MRCMRCMMRQHNTAQHSSGDGDDDGEVVVSSTSSSFTVEEVV